MRTSWFAFVPSLLMVLIGLPFAYYIDHFLFDCVKTRFTKMKIVWFPYSGFFFRTETPGKPKCGGPGEPKRPSPPRKSSKQF